ncbi:YeeE/YedE thiosulfate transporter family protein [Microcoleus sp. K4-B3]|uniref:YeeE/YedE thiosulfate transporter family protein n=1 Tax=Microcoleus sp. K4-B3 TaxID=2818791 RepID=UPI002FD5D37A
MFHKKSCRVCEVFVIGCGGPLAFGCNVGAFFSGIACISLHGWLWIAADEVGSVTGVKLRSLLRLHN